MKKTYNVEKTFSGMRIDRWIRNSIKKIPQSLIEKNLRKGKIKINGKKVKSSYKIKENDQIIFYNLASFIIGIKFYSHTETLAYIVGANIFIYLISYNLLKIKLKK